MSSTNWMSPIDLQVDGNLYFHLKMYCLMFFLPMMLLPFAPFPVLYTMFLGSILFVSSYLSVRDSIEHFNAQSNLYLT